MNPLERLKDAMKFKQVDFIPVTLLAAGDYVSWFSQFDTLSYYKDFEVKFRAQLKLIKSFPDALFIPGLYPDNASTAELSGFGCEIEYTKAGVPKVKGSKINIDEIDRIDPANPWKDGIMPAILSEYEQICKKVPNKVKRLGYGKGFALSLGPTDLACQLIGFDEFIINSISRPNLITNLMDKISKTIEDWVKAQFEVSNGSEILFLIEDFVSLLSPKQFNELTLSYLNKIINNVRKEDCLVILHNCNKVMHIIDYIKDLSIDALHFGPEVEPFDFRRRLSSIGLIGGISPFDLSLLNDERRLIKKCIELVERLRSSNGYSLSVSGSLPVGMKKESIKTIVKAAKSFANP